MSLNTLHRSDTLQRLEFTSPAAAKRWLERDLVLAEGNLQIYDDAIKHAPVDENVRYNEIVQEFRTKALETRTRVQGFCSQVQDPDILVKLVRINERIRSCEEQYENRLFGPDEKSRQDRKPLISFAPDADVSDNGQRLPTVSRRPVIVDEAPGPSGSGSVASLLPQRPW
ncbi:hypothetical protein HKX48_009470 [Thoreauomyces humboldtii]|nr:hypothetical protein HKX48_009470 [Thoreauomyces humboldtii]